MTIPNNPFARSLPSPFPSAAIPVASGIQSRGQESVSKVELLLQQALVSYGQVFQAGAFFPANSIYLKMCLQMAEVEVLKINVGVVRELSAEQKMRIISSIEQAWLSVYMGTRPALEHINVETGKLYGRICQDPQTQQLIMPLFHLMYIQHFTRFIEQISMVTLDALHRMRVDMISAHFSH